MRLISKSEFSRIAGVERATVGATKPGKALAAALANGKIDADHHDAVKFVQKHTGLTTVVSPAAEKAARKATGVKPRGPKRKALQAPVPTLPAPPTTAAPAPVTTPPPLDPADQVPEQLRAFLDWPLRKLIQQFGTEPAFIDWLKATKLIEEIQERQLKNAEARGELVRRDLVKLAIIDPFDEAHRKMLSDGSKTIARRVSTMAQAGKSPEDCEAFVRDQIGSFIRPVKDKVARSLKAMEQKADGK